MSLAVVVAVPLGLAIAFSSILRRTIYPFFVSLEMTPKIAFAPLFISWLGFGLLPKVIIVVPGLLLPDRAERHPRLRLAAARS